jgi:hypothetical protein
MKLKVNFSADGCLNRFSKGIVVIITAIAKSIAAIEPKNDMLGILQYDLILFETIDERINELNPPHDADIAKTKIEGNISL